MNYLISPIRPLLSRGGLTRPQAAFKIPKCFFSSKRLSVHSQQGNTIIITAEVPSINIHVESAWQEHCDLTYCNSLDVKMSVISQDISEVSVRANNIEETRSGWLKLVVPEIYNVSICAQDASISFLKKILGDIDVQCNTGRVCIDQLRGERIRINCSEASLEVKRKLEGNIDVQCSNIDAKMLHGDKINILTVYDAVVGALYSQNASLESKNGAVRVGLSHGHSVVKSKMECNLKGVDGSFHATSAQGDTNIQINKLYPGSESVATSLNGNVTALLDPEINARLECNAICGEIQVDSDAFCPSVSSPKSHKGVLSGQSGAVKRPNQSSRKFSQKSGKINIESAELSSLRSTTKQITPSVPDSSSSLPSILLVGEKSISVETISWIGNILKKHGFNENLEDRRKT